MSAPDLYQLFGAESLQPNDEQSEADGWATLFAIGFALLGAGIVIGAGVGLIISHWF